MKRFVSISLVFTLFFSITGYIIPCTLHCMHTQHEQSHAHNHDEMSHDMDTHHECDGMCSTEHLSKKSPRQAPVSPMHLSQFMAQVLTAALFENPSILLSASFDVLVSTKSVQPLPWFSTPPVPPPR